MEAARGRGMRIAESACAIGLIVMRAAVRASDPWWTDWVVPAAAVWLVCANLPPRSRGARLAAQGLMAGLALLYLACHLSYLLRAIGRGT